MTFHEFENETRNTLAKYIRDKAQIERYTELVLGLFEEGAEVTSIIRRSIPGNFHETKIDIPHLEEEIGDIIWYITHITMQLPDANLEKIAKVNLQKINAYNNQKEQLTFKEYQERAINTYRSDLPETKQERARYFSMGMIKEIGKVSELFAEHRIYNTALQTSNVEEKLGDTLWYLAAISENYDLDLNLIAKKNIQKTKSRYDKNGIAQIPEDKEGR